ncbi:skin secretory protein xP2-like protein [Lates japonicus]|uniref:Skin secretory protein xP2-like protein n=1 Tax=Lates japonicus TaxID=270547 RepID=A0AAD3MV60_LATJO|nr:skin secretory protein xP2-like protein [Lates japonicus]
MQRRRLLHPRMQKKHCLQRLLQLRTQRQQLLQQLLHPRTKKQQLLQRLLHPMTKKPQLLQLRMQKQQLLQKLLHPRTRKQRLLQPGMQKQRLLQPGTQKQRLLQLRMELLLQHQTQRLKKIQQLENQQLLQRLRDPEKEEEPTASVDTTPTQESVPAAVEEKPTDPAADTKPEEKEEMTVPVPTIKEVVVEKDNAGLNKAVPGQTRVDNQPQPGNGGSPGAHAAEATGEDKPEDQGGSGSP